MDISGFLKQNIIEIVKEIYKIDCPEFVVEHPANEDFGDYAINIALLLTKLVKQSPIQIANTICYEINSRRLSFTFKSKKVPLINSANVANPGFINIQLNKEWLHNVLYEELPTNDGYKSLVILGEKKKIALEHSNVNPNKAAHVGHLRNACVGQFIERVYERLGNDVVVQYYDNDLGVQVTTSLMGVEYFTDIDPSSYKKFDHYAWDVYSKMESLIASATTLQEKRNEILAKLENDKDPISQKQEELSQRILADQLETFAKLNFDYDLVVRERDIVTLKIWETAFDKLKTNENVYYAKEGPSKGCWLIRLGNSEDSKAVNSTINKSPQTENGDIEEDKIIVRSNGVPTYTGKDIAYHMWKFGLLDIDFYYQKLDYSTQEKDLFITSSVPNNDNRISFSGCQSVINVIDVKQSYAMEVVKKSLDYLGYRDEAKSMKHVNYGFVYVSKATAEILGIDTSDNKNFYSMSGRKGWGVKIDDFIDMVDKMLLEKYGDFNYIKEVRNGALKFQMLKINTFQDLIFDLEEALDIKGYSGPYLQYAYVRANSILAKASPQDIVFKEGFDLLSYTDWNEKEEKIIRYIYRYPEILTKAASDFAPNLLCEFLFELAKRFNSFYNDVSILNEPNEEAKRFRLFLTTCVKNVLKDGLWLLGIDVPQKM